MSIIEVNQLLPFMIFVVAMMYSAGPETRISVLYLRKT